MTTAQAGYHSANAATDNAADISPELNQAVTHFAEASADAFQQLTTTNADLQQQLAYLQTHMTNMGNSNTAMVPMVQPAYQVPQWQQNVVPPAQPAYQPPNQPFDYHQANYQQGQPNRAPTGRGRGHRRGCGRGRTNTYQPTNTRVPRPNQQQQQPGQNQANLTKKFSNWNYCFIHGHDVHGDHTSMTCKKPCYEHN